MDDFSIRTQKEQRRSLETLLSEVPFATRDRLLHRMNLARFWNVQGSTRVLEIGCGHGETTLALADAVSKSGKVIAVDSGSLDGGGSPTYGAAIPIVEACSVGNRIEFRFEYDLLDSKSEFPDGYFDLAIFSHCSWHMESAQVLGELFERVRPWANHLGYAEWNLRPSTIEQVPHALAAVFQSMLFAVWHEAPPLDVNMIIPAAQVEEMASASGWKITNRAELPSSIGCEDGEWICSRTRYLIDRIAKDSEESMPPRKRAALLNQGEALLEAIEGTRIQSLATRAFIAE